MRAVEIGSGSSSMSSNMLGLMLSRLEGGHLSFLFFQ